MQSAGCNAKHNFEQRLARLLLLCADRSHSDTFKISHKFLADMLGGGRPTISTTAGILKRKGLIEYAPEEIHILDFPGLTKAACECYSIIKEYLDNYQNSTVQSRRSRLSSRRWGQDFGKAESGFVSTVALSPALVRGFMPPTNFRAGSFAVRLVS